MAASRRWASLADPTHRLLWVMGGVTFLATHAQVVARGWLARDLTGSNAGLGGVLLAFGVPLAVATPIGGILADRMSRRTLIRVSLVLLTLSAGGLAGLEFSGRTTYAALLVAAGVQAVAFAIFTPARTALVSSLLRSEVLTNAIALAQTAQETARVLGPALAGVALGALTSGVGAVYAASAVATGLALASTTGLPADKVLPTGVERSPWNELNDGLAYVAKRRDLSVLLGLLGGVIMLATPASALLPGIADERLGLGAGAYGAMSAVAACGAVTSTVVLAGGSSRQGAGRVLSALGAGCAVGLAGLAVAPALGWVLVALVVFGAGTAGLQALAMSLLLELSDPAYHGRIQSLALLAFSAYGIAALPIAALADWVGTGWVLGGLAGLLALGIAAYTRFRRRHHPSSQGGPAFE